MIPELPFDAQYINVINSSYSPSTIHAKDTKLVAFFRKYLLERAISVFKIGGIPETWSRSLLSYTTFGIGFGAVFNTDKFGVVYNPCGLRGYDINYQPTNAVIANPLIKGILEPRINVDCTVIRLQPNYSSIMDIVNFYANQMAMCVEGMQINLINSKVAYVAEAPDKAAAETFKKAYDEVQAGNPFVVMKGKASNAELEAPGLNMFFPNVGQNFITNEMHLTLRKFEQDFDRWIGIPTANTEKRERLTDDEVNIGGIETRACVDLWYDTLSEDFERTNDMFSLNLTIDFRYNMDRGEVTDDDDDVDSGVV